MCWYLVYYDKHGVYHSARPVAARTALTGRYAIRPSAYGLYVFPCVSDGHVTVFPDLPERALDKIVALWEKHSMMGMTKQAEVVERWLEEQGL